MVDRIRYSAEEGLNVLKYLGLHDITSKEKEIFEKNWDKYYSDDFIETIKILYTTIAVLPSSKLAQFIVPKYRKAIFTMQMRKTMLSDELKSGIKLENIIEREPHRLF